MLFEAVYLDNSKSYGGSLADSKWNDIHEPIKRLTINLGCKHLILEGYDAYNHLIEKAVGLIGKVNQITKQVLFAKKGDKVYVFMVDFTNNCKLVQSVWDFGIEFNNKPTSGWKEGVSGDHIVDVKEGVKVFSQTGRD